MSALDELKRDLLDGFARADAEEFGDYVDDVFRDFEAEHPNLTECSITSCAAHKEAKRND